MVITRISEGKAVKSIKNLFKTKQDLESQKKAAAAKKGPSLGDEVEQSVTAFFQVHAHAVCHRS